MRFDASRIGAALVAALLCSSLSTPASAAMTSCRLRYSIRGWSFLYKTYEGTGSVSCKNGQSADVVIRTHGGGVTFGKSEISGVGRFTEVRDIGEIFGHYAEAGAHAGATKSADARVLTKGEVSLSLSGRGRGMDVGVAFGSFEIKRH